MDPKKKGGGGISEKNVEILQVWILLKMDQKKSLLVQTFQ